MRIKGKLISIGIDYKYKPIVEQKEAEIELTPQELSRDGLVPSGTQTQVLHGCRQLVS